jgi:GNAT superfamily N-acetyltransferase
MTAASLDQVHALYVHALGRITALGPGGSAERVGPLLCIDAGLGVSDFNIAVAVEPVAKPKRALRDALDWFEARALNARLDLRASVDGPLMAAAMVEGLNFKFREAVMVLEPLPTKLPSVAVLETREVVTPEDMELYCSVDREEHSDQEFQRAMVERTRGMEGVSLHLGLFDGRAVARSMGMVQGGLVGVYNVYVPPSQRRRGFGATLTASAIEAGRQAGATAACLESTELGFTVYEGMGFRKVDDYVVFGTI